MTPTNRDVLLDQLANLRSAFAGRVRARRFAAQMALDYHRAWSRTNDPHVWGLHLRWDLERRKEDVIATDTLRDIRKLERLAWASMVIDDRKEPR